VCSSDLSEPGAGKVVSPSVATSGRRCPAEETVCRVSGECVHNSWVCDGERDCMDGSDEEDGCAEKSCDLSEFRCQRSGRCIPAMMRCDGRAHCSDESDEEDCPTTAPCPADVMFDCTGYADKCINMSAVCDGVNDCGGHEDEAPLLCRNISDPCLVHNGGCTQNCVHTRIGHVCTCDKGFVLDADHVTCLDVNECSVHGMCSQKCDNRKGSYKCTCVSGYEWNIADHMCRALAVSRSCCSLITTV